MRRLVALLVMLIVPFQSAWSVTSSLHGPLDKAVVAGVMHAHDHVHPAQGGHDISLAGAIDGGHDEDGYHGSHCHHHHVFSFILPLGDSLSCQQLSSGPIQHAPAAFFSRTPPPLDRPPLARA